jgi:catechol 2,3-dioxygenase-like lactoylglutathione lyase family enzyme
VIGPQTPVRVSVVLDSVDPRAIAEFWCAALGYRQVGDLGQFVVLAPGPGEPGPVMILQRVPEERAGKNRAHLDLHPADPQAHLARLEGLGAQRIGDSVTELQEQLGVWWQRMADPQGNEFCVVADPPADPTTKQKGD